MGGVPARAADDALPEPMDEKDWSHLDAEVDRGIEAYDAGEYQRAKDILLPLAEQGHPKAMNMVGLMHHGSPVFPDDPVAECDWYDRAAKAGYASGMYNLARCYHTGSGRELDKKRDVFWLKAATENGHIRAMINLAGMDETEGPEYRRWMTMAADHGSHFALVDLWYAGYKRDVPDIEVRDITCVTARILIFREDIDVCD